MTSRRRFSTLALAGIAALGGYFLFASGEDSQVLELLRELSRAARVRPGEGAQARSERIGRAFAAALEPEVVLEVPELGEPARGRKAVEDVALGLGARYREARFEIEQTDVRVQPDGAEVTASITFIGHDGSSELRDTREVVLRLRRGADGLRIGSARVGPRSREEPEARP